MNKEHLAKIQVGDGKLPNKYWVFHYDEKAHRSTIDGFILIEFDGNKNAKGECLGMFNTYREALKCLDDKAYYPHQIIEDRLSGQVFESFPIVCNECKTEHWTTYEDIKFSKEKIEKEGGIFE